MKTAVNVFFFLSYYLLFTVFYNITIIISYLIIYLLIDLFYFSFFHFIPVRTCFICLVIILNLNFITLCKKTTRLFTTNTPNTKLLNISKQPINHLLSQPPPPPNVITIQMVNVYINFENWMCLCCYCALGCCSIWNMFIFVSTIMHL